MSDMDPITERLFTRREVLKAGIALGGVAVAGPLIAACGSKSTPSGTASSGGGGSVLLGSFDDPMLALVQKNILPQFEKETGIHVQWLGGDFSTFFQKGLNDGLAHGGSYDIYLMDDGWVPQYAASGILVDLSKEGMQPDTDFQPDWADLGYWPPKSGPRMKAFASATPTLIALPAVGDFETLTYRNDIYKAADVATWESLVSVGKQAMSTHPGHFAYVYPGAVGNAIVASFRDIQLAFGGQYFDDQWNVTFNDAIGQRAGKFLIETLGPLAPKGIAAFGNTEQAASFESGASYSSIQYSAAARFQDNPTLTKVYGKTAHAVVPKESSSSPAAKGQSGMWMAGISTSAPNKANAIKFLQWFTSNKVQIEMARFNITPVKVPAFDDPVAQGKYPFLAAGAEQIKIGLASKPRTPDWSKVEDLLGTQLNLALGRGKLGNALDVAAKQVTAYFKAQGYFA